VIYGSTFAVYNVHALVHLAADVQRFGHLDKFSAFPFENELGCLKRMLRKASNPLSQIIRLISEKRRFTLYTAPRAAETELLFEHSSGPCPPSLELAQQFRQLRKPQLFLSTSCGDNCIAVNGLGVFTVCNIVRLDGAIFLVCKSFSDISDLFCAPLQSSSLGIVSVSNLHNELTILSLSADIRKCVCLPTDSSMRHFSAIPQCHTEY